MQQTNQNSIKANTCDQRQAWENNGAKCNLGEVILKTMLASGLLFYLGRAVQGFLGPQ